MANTSANKTRTTTKKNDETKQAKARQIKEAATEERNEEAVIAKAQTDERDLEIANLKDQIEQLKQLMAEQAKAQPQQIVLTENSERVWFLWMADVADDNVTLIGEHGEYGRIVGKTGSFYVPKNDLSRILDTANRYYLQNRWMIVVSGLEDDEREALGVMYKEGELLDQKLFAKIIELKRDELLEIFPALCDAHKEMVASRFHEAYGSGKKINRQTVIDLNTIYPSQAFVDILECMNAEELGQQA